MAEYGEWNRKGATLSDVTAKAEYGVDRDVIVKGIQTGKLEYREGSVWGNPYLRVLRSQLEQYLAEELGEDYLRRVKHHTELRRVKKAVADLKKQLAGLQKRQQELEVSLGTWPRSWYRPLYALRGGLRGAGASSTDAKIAANIERGFCPKKRSAAVVPSGRVRKKL